MRLGTCLVAAVALCLFGCARTDQFQINVDNQTPSPLTLALTKNGPPFEKLWASPEELAIESPNADERHSYVVLPPGKSADVNVKGKFDRATRGYLRIYRGDLDVSAMSALSSGSPSRLDVLLYPGPNEIAVGMKDGRLALVPTP